MARDERADGSMLTIGIPWRTDSWKASGSGGIIAVTPTDATKRSSEFPFQATHTQLILQVYPCHRRA